MTAGLGYYGVDDYLTMDARVAWRPNQNLELNLTGRNLLSSSHLEAIGDIWAVPAEVPRSLYLGFKLEF